MIRFSQLCALKKEWRPVPSYSTGTSLASGLSLQPSAGGAGSSTVSNCQETLELRKIKKVQSFFRGWLCRRRWKQIVEQYIKSPHAESMRKRNRYKSASYKFFTLGIWRTVPPAVSLYRQIGWNDDHIYSIWNRVEGHGCILFEMTVLALAWTWRCWVGVSGQLQAPIALPAVKEHLIPIWYEAWSASESVCTF